MKTSDILKLLEHLVAMKSVANNPRGLAETISYAERYFKIPELKTKRINKNGKENLVVFSSEAKSTSFDIVLNAHLDVVPADDKLFSLRVQDGKAYGRGVYDMKGAGATLMYLYKDLAVARQLPPTVALTLVTDEEVGGHNGVKALLEDEKITANFFLAGEPTNFDICYQQKGILWLEFIERGKAAHGSRPWEGENANISLAKKIATFYDAHPQPKNKEDWKTSYTLSILKGGGDAKNVVADKAMAYMDIRRIQTESSEDIIKNLHNIFGDTEINVIMDEDCLDTDPNSKYLKSLSESTENVLKKKPALTKETFGSDARFYSAIGTPAINFGPTGGDMHGDNEWLDIKSLEDYYTIVKDFLLFLK